MKFQFDEIVKHGDIDQILRLLEHHFHDVSLKTLLTERQLEVYGVGPSPRTMNRNDKIILQAISQRTTTIIHTEVSFLPSAFMGDMPQDIAVRSKIDGVFERMQAQLKIDTAPYPMVPKTSQADDPLPAKTTSQPASTIIEPPSSTSPTTKQLPLQPAHRGQGPPEQSLELKAGKSIAMAPTRPLTPESSATFSPATPVAPALFSSALTSEISQIKRKRTRAPLAIFIVLLFVFGTIYLLQHHYPAPSPFLSKSKKQPVASMIDQPRETHASQISANTSNAQASPAESSQAISTNQPMDLKEWIGAWTTAMRTRNARLQISFYADPVTRYFLSSNVSRNQLLMDKQSEIQKRERLWTVKAENVIVMHKTPSTAIIQLTKHVVAESTSSLIREQRIKTQLKLNTIDGSWKITAEQTLE